MKYVCFGQYLLKTLFFSFFPNIFQPGINTLVNPIHALCIRIGAIKPHSPSKSVSTSLTSVVSIPSVDMHDMERRRQIALKALSERLSRTTDSSRANVLPRSFPHSHQHAHHGHHGHHSHHGHHGHHHGSDSDQPPFIAPAKVPQTFVIPAIPMPAPPPKNNEPLEQTQQTTSQEDLIVIDDSTHKTSTSHTAS